MGATINIKEPVDSSANLPTTGNALWDGRVTSDTGHLWICTALPATWSDVGQFRGQDGVSAQVINLYATAQTFAVNEWSNYAEHYLCLRRNAERNNSILAVFC